jgi:hypothetical protein
MFILVGLIGFDFCALISLDDEMFGIALVIVVLAIGWLMQCYGVVFTTLGLGTRALNAVLCGGLVAMSKVSHLSSWGFSCLVSVAVSSALFGMLFNFLSALI